MLAARSGARLASSNRIEGDDHGQRAQNDYAGARRRLRSSGRHLGCRLPGRRHRAAGSTAGVVQGRLYRTSERELRRARGRGGGCPRAHRRQRHADRVRVAALPDQAILPALQAGVEERAKLGAPEGDAEQIEAINDAGRRMVSGFERIASSKPQAHALMLGQVLIRPPSWTRSIVGTGSTSALGTANRPTSLPPTSSG
jgi:hypothetical protein